MYAIKQIKICAEYRVSCYNGSCHNEQKSLRDQGCNPWVTRMRKIADDYQMNASGPEPSQISS